MFLTRLPPELRDRIYKLVLVALPKHQPIQIKRPKRAKRSLKMNFLWVCRQIYQEARHIPYQYNEFEVLDRNIVCFLSMIQQKNRDKLERLTIIGRPDYYKLNTWALIRRCANLKFLRIKVGYNVNTWRSSYREEKMKFNLDGRLEVSLWNWMRPRGPNVRLVDEHEVRDWWASAETVDICVVGLQV